MTHFQVLYGWSPPYQRNNTTIQALDEMLVESDELMRTLKANLTQAQNRMVQKFNAHRREMQFEVEDIVLVRLQPYRQTSVANRPFPKLAKRYYGPYKIVERIGAMV